MTAILFVIAIAIAVGSFAFFAPAAFASFVVTCCVVAVVLAIALAVATSSDPNVRRWR